MNTIEILDTLKAEYGLTSDYQLAKKLGTSTSRVGNYRSGRSKFDDEMVLQVENLLDLPEGSLLLEIQSQRTKCKTAAEILHKLSKQLMATAAALFLTLSTGYGSFSSDATASPISQNLSYYVYYVK